MKRMILIVTVVVLLLSVVKAGYYTLAYGGTDLRSISIASKQLDTGRTAYFYRWAPGQPEKYLDPNVPPTTASNAVTVAPGTLYWVSFFSGLRYPILRIVWTALQYLLILAVFCYFFFQQENSVDRRWSIVVVGGLFFLCSPIWFLNIERGQVYFLFTFLFALIYGLYRSADKAANIMAGVMIAVAIYCRPNFVFLLVPIVLVRNWRVLVGWLGAMAILLVHAYTHRGLWAGYSAMIHEFADPGAFVRIVLRPGYEYPSVIEGAKNLTKYKTDFVCGGIHPINTWLAEIVHIGSINFYVVLLLVILLGLVLFFRKELARKEASTVLLFGFLLYMTAEYVMPASRSAYNLIVWVFPVLVFLQRPRLPDWLFVLLITGLCLINGLPFYFFLSHDVGELLLVFCLCYYIKTPPPPQAAAVKIPPESAPSSY